MFSYSVSIWLLVHSGVVVPGEVLALIRTRMQAQGEIYCGFKHILYELSKSNDPAMNLLLLWASVPSIVSPPFSSYWRQAKADHGGPVQIHHISWRSTRPVSWNHPQLPQSHSCCQHLLCGVWAHEENSRRGLLDCETKKMMKGQRRQRPRYVFKKNSSEGDDAAPPLKIS